MNINKLQSIDLNLLKAFAALLTTNHARKAAESIGVTQPALSYSLKKLRQEIGDPLFIKTPKGMEPTETALTLANAVRTALQQANQVFNGVQPFAASKSNKTFTFGATDYFQATALPLVFSNFSRQAAHANLVVKTPNPNGAMAQLSAGVVDLIFGVEYQEVPGVYRLPIFDDSVVCVARKGNPAIRHCRSIEDYALIKHLVISPFDKPWVPPDYHLEKAGLTKVNKLVVPSYLVAPSLLCQTDCVLTVAQHVYNAFQRSDLVKFATPGGPYNFKMSMFWHERTHREPAHLWLRKLVFDSTATLRGKSFTKDLKNKELRKHLLKPSS